MVALKESGVSATKISKQLKLAESTVATLYQRARAKGYESVIVLDGDILGLYESDGSEDDH